MGQNLPSSPILHTSIDYHKRPPRVIGKKLPLALTNVRRNGFGEPLRMDNAAGAVV